MTKSDLLKLISKLVLVLAFLFILVDSSWAEPNASITPSPSPSPESALDKALEIGKLRLALADSSYKITKNQKDLAEIVLSYEKLIELSCMYTLPKSWKYEAKEKSQDCQSYIDSLLELDLNNPTAICARDGIDHQNCINAWLPVGYDSFEIADSASQTKSTSEQLADLDAKLRESKNSALVETLQTQISQLRESFNTETPQETEPGKESPHLTEFQKRQKLVGLYSKLFALTCTGARLNLAVDTNSTSIPTAPSTINSKPETPKDPHLKQGFTETQNAAEPIQTPIQEKKNNLFQRQILLPKLCQTSIDQSLEAIDRLGIAICYRYGFYSARCIRALRAEKQKLLTTKTTQSKQDNSPPVKDGSIGKF